METINGLELSKMTIPPETPEEAYRRAYRDGWVVALDTMLELVAAGLSFDAAHEQAWNHWQDELRAWEHGDTSRIVFPPELAAPPRRRRKTGGK